jgi:Fe2+ transport system protein FeoA
MKQDRVLPLTSARCGQPVVLVQISGGHRVAHRLAELGLTPGVELEVLQNQGGPILLAVRSTRLAIGRGVANKVMVRSLEGH